MQLKNYFPKNDWTNYLNNLAKSDYFVQLNAFLEKEMNEKTILPPKEQLFEAFRLCPFSEVKIIIIGQDPYHGEGQAHGLCFSVKNNQKIPPSLRNIYKELHSEYQKEIPTSGNLSFWATQGVFMINNVLSVEKSKADSHKNKGWEKFTDDVIRHLSEKKENLVFLLWGAKAQTKKILIDQKKHLILESVHPSPLSAHRGFFGCNHFKQTNVYLKENGLKEIKWLPENHSLFD